jgi:HK97 family phage major capsid protein
MTRLQRLELKRADLLDKQEAFFKKYDENADIPAAEATEAETRNNELKSIDADIAREESLAQMRASTTDALKSLNPEPGQVQVAGTVRDGETVVERNQKGALSLVYEEGTTGLDKKTLGEISTNAYKIAFKNYMRNGHGVQGLGSGDLKALSAGADADGGFLVPDDMLNRIVQKDPSPSAINSTVTRLQTSRDALTIPKVNYAADDVYTTGIRIKKVDEITSSSNHRADQPKFGTVRIPVHTYMLSLPITLNLLEDSAFPLLNWITQKFAETRDLLYDDEILNGNGIGGPAGLLMNPGGSDQIGVVNSGHASQLTADGLIDLHYSVPPQYRTNMRWIMSYMNAAKNLAKLKDAQNRYLFNMGGASDGGLQGERPDSLIGRQISYSEFMPEVAADKFPIIFGDPTGYYFVERVGFSIQIIREKYAEDNMVVALGRLRIGGQPVETWKMKAQKVAA